MTVIRPNSVSGITSITAQANEINFFRSNGTLAGLQLNGVNFNTTAGISTFAALKVTGNLDVEGVLTYQDVTNVDSVGIITARSTIDAQGDVSIADKIIHTGDTNTAIRFPAADTITAETGGSERLRINSDGSLITNTTSTLIAKYNSSNSAGSYLEFAMGASGANIGYLGSADQLISGAAIADLAIRSTQNFAISTGGASERFRISSTGQIICNTTQTVSAEFNTSHGAGSYLQFDMGASGANIGYMGAGSQLVTGSATADLGIRSAANLVFSTGGSTERLRITSTGVIQTGSKTITGGNNLAIQNFAVKGIWSGSPSIGKSIELISGYDSSVKMAAVGYNLTDTNTGSTYGGDLTFHTQPLYSSPTTPLPERMRISSSGYVTKPSQPAFHAYGNNSWTQYTGANNTVKLLNSNCNVGSHYKTSGTDEGKFVCPVAGNYLFYLTLYTGRTDNSQTDNNNYLSINLYSSTGSLANKGGHHIAHYYNEADRDSTRTMSYIKTCAVGEKIYISVSCNGAGYQLYGGHSAFGGYLLG